MKQIAVMTLVIVSLSCTCAAGVRDADQDAIAELRRQVTDLQAQLDSFRAAADQDWLTARRADEIRAIVHDVLTDADTRSSLLQSGMTAGWDKGFFLSSADGNYKLKLSGQMQVRWVFNNQDGGVADSTRSGFENRRTKLDFSGHIVDPTWQYKVLLAMERDGGSAILDEGWIRKDLDHGWSLRVGQFKPGFLREELVSSRRQLAVERSLVNEEFNQDRVQGIELGFEQEKWRAAVSYHDGFGPGSAGSDNTGWQVEDTEYAFTGRAELLLAGDWKQFDDFSAWKGGETGFMIGVAGDLQKDEFGTGGLLGNNDEIEQYGFTVDASAEFDGAGAYGAFVWRTLDSDTADSLDQWAVIVQGSFFLTEEWEGFARYEYGDSDIEGDDDLSVITVGVNRYWDKHNLKWTTDVGYGLDGVSGTWSTSSAGWRTDAADDDGQIVVRSQFQLLF
jgi:hypothetical protein